MKDVNFKIPINSEKKFDSTWMKEHVNTSWEIEKNSHTTYLIPSISKYFEWLPSHDLPIPRGKCFAGRRFFHILFLCTNMYSSGFPGSRWQCFTSITECGMSSACDLVCSMRVL